MFLLLKFIWFMIVFDFGKWKICGLLLLVWGWGVIVFILMKLKFICENVLIYFVFLFKFVVKFIGFLNFKFKKLIGLLGIDWDYVVFNGVWVNWCKLLSVNLWVYFVLWVNIKWWVRL